MAQSTCGGCGAPIDISKNVDGVVECEFCHRKNTVARSVIADVVNFLAIGEHALGTGRFDEAYAAFKRASELDSDESEAYFGMALSEFKVRYIKDEVNGVLQPICHEISDKAFTVNRNYLAAIGCAAQNQAELYAERAEKIEHIRREFHAFKSSGMDYDCFICAKLTDTDGNRTKDYKTADDIYWYLKNNGFNPFFSEYEVKGRTGADYEALICYALYACECMIVVCGNEEYLHTPWVKNEYMRFIGLINDEQKERDAIAIAFNGKPIERLPGRKGRLQGIDMAALGASDLVKKFVSNHTAEANKTREIAAASAETKAANPAAIASLLIRAKQFLSSGSYNIARDYCYRVLDVDPENAEAWFLMLLAERQISDADNCVKFVLSQMHSALDIDGLREGDAYKNAKKYANGFSRFVALDNALTKLYNKLSLRENSNSINLSLKFNVTEIVFVIMALVGAAIFICCIVMTAIQMKDNAFCQFFFANPFGLVFMIGLMAIGIVGLVVRFVVHKKRK